MHLLHLLSTFTGGAVLLNAIPHLVSGTMGRKFPSPFGQPRGEGLSSATVNVLWGLANLVVAYLLVLKVGDFDLRDGVQALALALGMLAIGLGLARHFGGLNGGRGPDLA